MSRKDIYIYILAVFLILVNLVDATNISAVGYSSDLGISFTFLPTLKIILSSTGCGSGTGGLCIDNLSPGTANDSNILTITVLNNTGNGYTLTANVGDNTTNNGRFNTSDLVHTDTNITNKFTSLATNANIANNTDFTDSTWGYSYKDETLSNPTWSNYSGLPLYSNPTPTTLKSSLSPATSAEGDNIKFKIAAKSASNQASGEYNNVINFMITSQPIPVTLSMAYENAGKQKYNGYYKMQDMTPEICSNTEVVGPPGEAILIDTRDNKTYVARKLADNKCWMVQNLALGGSSAITLTPTNSDVISNFTLLASSDSFGHGTAAGIDINRMHDNGDSWASPIVVGEESTINTIGTPPSQTQYLGNYYNYYTATAGSGTYSMGTDGVNAPTSICPKGWRLPTGGSIDSVTGNGELLKLWDAYNNNFNNFISNISATLSGSWQDDRALLQGSRNIWWSRTTENNKNAYTIHIMYTGAVLQPRIDDKGYAYSVRCVAR